MGLGIGCLVAAAGAAPAADEAVGEFAPPVRLKAGDKWLGGGRLYPSPVLHDLDGDGRREVLVADLAGAITVARITRAGDGAPTLSAETPLKGADGQPLRFHNW